MIETQSTSLRRTSTIRHQSATGAAGRLTVGQGGLFDGVLVDDSGDKHDGRVDRWSFLEACRLDCRIRFNSHLSTAGGHHLTARSASVLHGSRAQSSWWKSSSWGWWANVTRLSCVLQDHYELRICTWNQLSTRRKKPLGDTAPLLLMDRMRACVCVVLRARSVWTRMLSSLLTDVWTRPVGIGRARSLTKSEYAQPPEIVSSSLFDTYSV